MLTDDEKRDIDRLLEHYDRKRPACIEALKLMQNHRRWISNETLREVADYLEMTPEELEGVATFYNLIYRRPVGRHVIHVCDSVSCWIMGYDRLCAALRKRLGVAMGETTADDRFTLLPIVCLGTCDHAPAMMIDEDLHRDLDEGQLEGILERYE